MNTRRKPFIVAEMSANHLGSLDRALEIVDQAAYAGADAIKIQTWTPGMMVLDEAYTLQNGPWRGRTLTSLYEEAITPWEWHQPIFDRARENGLVPFASVFDLRALQFLEQLGCPIYKIASFEIVDVGLIAAAAATGKPLIISTGMATKAEIDAAVRSAKAAAPTPDITLLKCTSAYPARAADANLSAALHMLDGLDVQGVGLSDHTEGIGVAVVAAAMGADVIEKHLTLRRSDGGPDAGFSLEPAEFARMVEECRRVVGCQGSGTLEPITAEEPQRALRRSLYWAKTLPAGHVVEAGDLVTARPALGAPPILLPAILGQRLCELVQAGTPVSTDMLRRVS